MAKLKPGFSLVEVLVFLLLVVVMTTTLLSSVGNLSKTKGVNLESIATKIASREIEDLRKTDFAALPGSGSITDPDLSKLNLGTATRTISDYQNDPDIRKITVSVDWVENSVAQNVKVETLIYKNGI